GWRRSLGGPECATRRPPVAADGRRQREGDVRVGMMCAVSFTRYGKLYYLDPGPFSPAIGDKVLVPTDAGPEVAECVWAPQWVSEDVGGLPTLVGLAGESDLERDEASRRRRAEARVAAKRLIREHGLRMKVVGIDHLDRENAFTIYFSSE